LGDVRGEDDLGERIGSGLSVVGVAEPRFAFIIRASLSVNDLCAFARGVADPAAASAAASISASDLPLLRALSAAATAARWAASTSIAALA